MKFAMQVLNRYAPTLGPASRRKHYISEVICVYCGGRGTDPLYSNGSRCPVCNGAGRVNLTPPVITCRLCGGSGRVNGDLVCLTCRGVGMVSVRVEADTCPRCGGAGQEGVFYCHTCKGQGVI